MSRIDKLNVFDTETIEKWMTHNESKVRFTLGIDCSLGGVNSYCLVKQIEGNMPEIVLSKSMKEEPREGDEQTKFEIEVANLAEYFNADIITEK